MPSFKPSHLLAAALLALATPAVAQTEPPKPDQIIVNASGGSMQSAQREAFSNLFEKTYGIKVVDTSPVDFGKLRAMVDSGNVEWTITELGGQDAIRAAKMDLLEPIDPKIVDRSRYPEPMRAKYTFASSVYTTVLAYRTDVWGKEKPHPKGWAEFWDVKKFPGPRSMRNHPVDNLEFALLADGVSMDKLYPIDMDRAFKKLEEIRPHVTVWWTTGQQPAQLLLDKEVVLATGWNGRFYDLIKKGAPIEIEWLGGSMKNGTYAIPKGAPNAYWGQKFLAMMADPQRQAIYANIMGYPGLNLDSVQYVDKKVQPYLPTYPENIEKQFWLSAEWWAENGAKAQERWNQFMLQR